MLLFCWDRFCHTTDRYIIFFYSFWHKLQIQLKKNPRQIHHFWFQLCMHKLIRNWIWVSTTIKSQNAIRFDVECNLIHIDKEEEKQLSSVYQCGVIWIKALECNLPYEVDTLNQQLRSPPTLVLHHGRIKSTWTVEALSSNKPICTLLIKQMAFGNRGRPNSSNVSGTRHNSWCLCKLLQ